MKDQVVSVTLDHWTSKANHNYSGMTSHFVDNDWVLRKIDLGCFLHGGRGRGAVHKLSRMNI
jgi:hypothetical protein